MGAVQRLGRLDAQLGQHPEVALAKRIVVDHRTDIYSLGATLYELLTLEPAFTGSDRQELLRQIAFEEPRTPRRANRTIPVELETIVLKALEKNPADRYATAKELAEELRHYLADQPIRAKRPGLLARGRKWTRRHQSVVTTAALGLLAVLLILGGAIGWVLGDRAARQRGAEGKVLEALGAAAPGLGKGDPYDASLMAAVERAQAQLGGGAVLGADFRCRAQQLRADHQMLVELEQAWLQAAIGGRESFLDYGGADRLFAQAFGKYGIDTTALPPQETAARLRESALRTHLVAALDQWAFVRRELSLGNEELRAAADLADDDEWTRSLRTASQRSDRPALEALAKEGTASRAPTDVVRLANALRNAGSGTTAEQFLWRAQSERPADLWINFELAVTLAERQPPDLAQAVRFLQAALALRPKSAVIYAHLGIAMRRQRKYAEAEAACRKAIDLKADLVAAHFSLGDTLRDQGRKAEAEAAYREVCRLKPDDVGGNTNVGHCLRDQGKMAEAEMLYRKVVDLKPKSAEALANLGDALYFQQKLAEAEAVYHKAIAVEPNNVRAYTNLGNALGKQGKLPEAEAAYRKAFSRSPDDALAHNNLGMVLSQQGKLPQAEAAFRQAINLKPDYPDALLSLGRVLRAQHKLKEAEAANRQAIQLRPDFAEAHCNLGKVFQDQGRFVEALTALKRGHELGSRRPGGWSFPSERWVREAEQLVVLAEKLPKVLTGETQPADAAELIELAQICQLHKEWYAAAARLYREAFDAQPSLAEKLDSRGSRYDAACAAALAGCGQGKDADKLDKKESTGLRKQALDWLRADLAAWRHLLDKEPKEARPVVLKTMEHWQQDKDFAGVRGDEALAKLPEAERQEWQKLWAEVDQLRQEATKPAK
jgi:tetratricopeptide (TPR) repeat protein